MSFSAAFRVGGAGTLGSGLRPQRQAPTSALVESLSVDVAARELPQHDLPEQHVLAGLALRAGFFWQQPQRSPVLATEQRPQPSHF
jgi:hypothetical protein